MYANMSPARTRHSGFTLIEIMVTITIVAILAGLLIPAVVRALSGARITEVHSDMEKLKTAITAFKVQFLREPPSEINLYEAPAGWTADPRSRSIIRELWPRFNFRATRELDGDTTTTNGTVNLSGAECLVYFLGGGVDPTSGALVGFSANPTDPLRLDAGATTTRVGPFYEFGSSGLDSTTKKWTGRLIDADSDNYPELLDTLPSQQAPYLYFSSDGGKRYSADDNSARIAAPYYKGSSGTRPYNEDSFQIISPGVDFSYGTGGNFVPGDLSALSEGDRDNIVNFHPGTLSDG